MSGQFVHEGLLWNNLFYINITLNTICNTVLHTSCPICFNFVHSLSHFAINTLYLFHIYVYCHDSYIPQIYHILYILPLAILTNCK